MAASACTAFAVAGSKSLEFSTLSSKAAFSSNNVVQAAPVTRARVAGIRASSNNAEEARPARREVLAGILAAGAALGFSQQASAAVNPVGDVQGAVDEVSSGLKRRIDGLFGSDKPYPQRNTQVTGKGAVADAKARVGSFLDKSQNPLTTNIEKASKETVATGPNSASARAGREILGQDSTRVDEATERVNTGAEELKDKAIQAFGDAKDAVGTASESAPDVTLPSPPQGSGLFQGLASKVDDVKSKLPGQ